VSIDACAGLVERGDPDRFAAVMAAPVAARARLFPIYAFNLEVARAPWVTQEPMIAEMRLQWWRDTVEMLGGDGPVRAHEVVAPLAGVVRGQGLPLAVMDRLIEARRWDIYRDPFEDQAAMDAYLEDTGGALMWLACRALGAAAEAEPVARDSGWAAGLAAFLRAVPELEARGRIPLVDGRPEAVAALAQRGLERLSRARAARSQVAADIWPALLAGWQTQAILAQVVTAPGRVAEGRLGLSDFARKGRLILAAATGRW
jgi:phytoene/squalene synthetase